MSVLLFRVMKLFTFPSLNRSLFLTFCFLLFVSIYRSLTIYLVVPFASFLSYFLLLQRGITTLLCNYVSR